MRDRIEIEPDTERRRVVVRIRGEAGDDDYLRVVRPAFLARPEMWNWGHVYDLRGYEGDIGNEPLLDLSQVFHDHGGGRGESLILTRDPGFDAWCRYFDAIYPGRSHRRVNTPAEAGLEDGAGG